MGLETRQLGQSCLHARRVNKHAAHPPITTWLTDYCPCSILISIVKCNRQKGLLAVAPVCHTNNIHYLAVHG